MVLLTLGGYRGQSGDDLNAKLTTGLPISKSVSEDSVAEGVQSAVKMQIKMTLCWYLIFPHRREFFRIFGLMDIIKAGFDQPLF